MTRCPRPARCEAACQACASMPPMAGGNSGATSSSFITSAASDVHYRRCGLMVDERLIEGFRTQGDLVPSETLPGDLPRPEPRLPDQPGVVERRGEHGAQRGDITGPERQGRPPDDLEILRN